MSLYPSLENLEENNKETLVENYQELYKLVLDRINMERREKVHIICCLCCIKKKKELNDDELKEWGIRKEFDRYLCDGQVFDARYYKVIKKEIK
jgi:hypothetical protein